MHLRDWHSVRLALSVSNYVVYAEDVFHYVLRDIEVILYDMPYFRNPVV